MPIAGKFPRASARGVRGKIELRRAGSCLDVKFPKIFSEGANFFAMLALVALRFDRRSRMT
jgi:hypothetical protein